MILFRALSYAVIFVAFFLVFLPARVVQSAGTDRPENLGALQIAGAVIVIFGGAIALWCVLSFALRGRGTPAPFDAPQRLVIDGPYRFVRNPMYIGAVTALAGAALFYQSVQLLLYTVVFFAAAHLFVILYEERTLQRKFGLEYDAYTARVPRWLPTLNPNEPV